MKNAFIFKFATNGELVKLVQRVFYFFINTSKLKEKALKYFKSMIYIQKRTKALVYFLTNDSLN